eukprot:scaffold8708_cov179-Ochromonas_danica.AAC.9
MVNDNSNEYDLLRAVPADLDTISYLEAVSYPNDEAATPEKIRYRVENAGDFFHVLKDSHGQIVGFINGTCVMEHSIHHESMSEHHPRGRTLVIHSVVIKSSHRGQKLASLMLKKYISKICGFQVIRLSPVVHGEVQVDAFVTSRAFSGNPAAVVFSHGDVEWMQNVAMENNLAETSFLEKIDEFTPTTEVELCGHATLAAAHALYDTGRVSSSQMISFHSLYSGILTAKGNEDGTITLSFPATPVTEIELAAIDLDVLRTAFGTSSDEVLYTGRSKYDLFLELSTEAFERIKDINFSALTHFGGRGVIITTKGGGNSEEFAHCDFSSRCFFPLAGINEDPVCGSAHCALAVYWAEKIKREDNRLTAFQASPRGGLLKLRLVNDRAEISGGSRTVMTTRILA